MVVRFWEWTISTEINAKTHAESRMVGDGEIAGGHAAGQNRKLQIPEFYLPPQPLTLRSLGQISVENKSVEFIQSPSVFREGVALRLSVLGDRLFQRKAPDDDFRFRPNGFLAATPRNV